MAKKQGNSGSSFDQHVPHWAAYTVLIVLFVIAVMLVKNALREVGLGQLGY